MDYHLKSIEAAAALDSYLPAHAPALPAPDCTEPALSEHSSSGTEASGLVWALCRAMAAQVPPADAAAAAGMNLSQLFNTLREHH